MGSVVEQVGAGVRLERTGVPERTTQTGIVGTGRAGLAHPVEVGLTRLRRVDHDVAVLVAGLSRTDPDPLMPALHARDRVGLHTENIQLDESASLFSLDRGFTDEETKAMQKSIDSVYGRFLKLVSGSRKIPVEKVRTLAGGRVWSGTQALRHKLVDHIGGVDDCIQHIAKTAKLGDKYRVTHRPQTQSGLDLSSLLGSEDEDIISIDGLGIRCPYNSPIALIY